MHECANCSCGNMTAKQFAGLFSVCGAEDGISGRAETEEAGEEPPRQTGGKCCRHLVSGCIPIEIHLHPPEAAGWAAPRSFGSGAGAGLQFVLADLSPSAEISFQVGGCSM